MKTNLSLPNKPTHIFFLAALMLLLLLSATSTTFAGSGTWLASPGSGDWNTGTNWSSGTVPNAASDTATFGLS
jgi:hypothetical protein